MKTNAAILMFIGLACAAGAATAQPAPAGPCEAKRASIGHEIDAAKAQGRTQQVAGLQRALAEVKRTCSDDKLRAEHAQQVKDEERKVADRKSELAAAQREGSASKIARRKAKLADAQAELERVKAAP